MRKYRIMLALAILSGCNSPDAWDIFKSAGHTKVEIRELASFSQIVIPENIEFRIIVQDTASRVAVSAGKNLLPKIKTDVSNGVLTVKDKNGYDFVRSSSRITRMEIYTKQLSRLETSTGKNFYIQIDRPSIPLEVLLNQCSGDMYASIKVSELTLNLYESTSKIEIAGAATRLFYNAGQSYGPALLSDFLLKKATIEQNGSNTVELNVSDSLNVSISGIGDVYYRGDPFIISNITGKGKLTKK